MIDSLKNCFFKANRPRYMIDVDVVLHAVTVVPECMTATQVNGKVANSTHAPSKPLNRSSPKFAWLGRPLYHYAKIHNDTIRPTPFRPQIC